MRGSQRIPFPEFRNASHTSVGGRVMPFPAIILGMDVSLRLGRTYTLNPEQLHPHLLWGSGFGFQVSGLRKDYEPEWAEM